MSHGTTAQLAQFMVSDGIKWNTTTITYNDDGLSAGRQAEVDAAATLWEGVVHFVKIHSSAMVTWDDVLSGQARTDYTMSGATIIHADVNVGADWYGSSISMYDYSFQTIVHEWGHVLGLKHSHIEYDNMWTDTIMSYNNPGVWQLTPTTADLLAVTLLYNPPPSIDMSHSHQANGGFDASYYREVYTDIVASGADPFAHYNMYGWHESRKPNAVFDTSYYLSSNPDVAAAGINPLQHYEASGWHEGRKASALFDGNHYLLLNPDVAAAGVNPMDHYINFGHAEGRLI